MKPSDADFRDDIKAKMVEYLKFLRENNAHAALNLYPIHYCHENDLDPDFAFFDNKSKFFAQRFYKDFLPYVIGNKGTPLRPGMPIDQKSSTTEIFQPIMHSQNHDFQLIDEEILQRLVAESV
ncbi:Glucan endo-1 [Forsythia ovata]|uniref:Glucan endo-1 n=1 Tax=Forsythia ovata TaxID=205694 RepID=A0ABD1WKD8_9LAMI